MALGTNQQTTTTTDVFAPAVWSNDVMDFLKSELVMLPRIKHYDSEVASKGQSVEVPFVESSAAADKAANTEVTLTGTTFSKVSILINKHKEKSYLLEDVAAVQSKYELRSEFTKAAAFSIAEAIDSDIITELKAGSTSTAVGTFGTALNANTIISAKVALDQAKAPNSDRTLAVDAYQHGELLKIDNFVRYDALGKSNIENGFVGRAYGFDVVMSQNLPWVDTTVDEHTGIAFHKDAVAIAHQVKPRTQAHYVPQHLGWLLTVDTVYGVKTLRGAFSVLVKS